MGSIFQTLGLGAGFDTKAVVRELVAAERAPREKLLDARAKRIEAHISALGRFQAAFAALSNALDQRIASGAVGPIARVSDPSVLAVSAAPGRVVPQRMVEVRTLASAQTLATNPVADPQAILGSGTLTIRFGTVAGSGPATGFTPGTRPDLVVEIGPGQGSLAGIRDAINVAARAAGAGLRAELVSDPAGTRLLLSGETGAGAGFLVETETPDLAPVAFTVGGGGMARTAAAGDAELVLDGVPLRRAANSFDDLLPGVSVQLLRAAPGLPVRVSARHAPAEIAATVSDLAGALNELLGLGRDLTRGAGAPGEPGALVSNTVARSAVAALVQLTTRPLAAPEGDAPQQLADIGLTLDRDGKVRVDQARLQRAADLHPGRIEAMLRELARAGTFTSPPGPLKAIAADLRAALEGRPGQPPALQRESEAIAAERARLEARMARYEAGLTRQYAALDRQVGEARQTLAFLSRQTDLWFGRRER